MCVLRDCGVRCRYVSLFLLESSISEALAEETAFVGTICSDGGREKCISTMYYSLSSCLRMANAMAHKALIKVNQTAKTNINKSEAFAWRVHERTMRKESTIEVKSVQKVSL